MPRRLSLYTTRSVFHGDHRGQIYPQVIQEQLDQGYDCSMCPTSETPAA